MELFSELPKWTELTPDLTEFTIYSPVKGIYQELKP